ncbi:E3 SUMO-protein ligase [Nymphaea thermarum]|nr:E3 SUMO-protein ligase [Nymphaea thermarum]
MDSVSSCKEKLQYFRIKELKDVLTQIGLAKQGKKQERQVAGTTKWYQSTTTTGKEAHTAFYTLQKQPQEDRQVIFGCLERVERNYGELGRRMTDVDQGIPSILVEQETHASLLRNVLGQMVNGSLKVVPSGDSARGGPEMESHGPGSSLRGTPGMPSSPSQQNPSEPSHQGGEYSTFIKILKLDFPKISEVKLMSWKGYVIEYPAQFEELNNMVSGWPTEAQVGAFVGELKEKLRIDVLVVRPQTLLKGFGLERIAEEKYKRLGTPARDTRSGKGDHGNLTRARERLRWPRQEVQKIKADPGQETEPRANERLKA